MFQLHHALKILVCLCGSGTLGCGPRQAWTIPTNLKHLKHYSMSRVIEYKYSTSTQPVELEMVMFVVSLKRCDYPVLSSRSNFHAPRDIVEAYKSISEIRQTIKPTEGASSRLFVPIDDSITSIVLCLREAKTDKPQDQSVKWRYFEFQPTVQGPVQIPNIASLPLLESNASYDLHFAKISDAEAELKAVVEGLVKK